MDGFFDRFGWEDHVRRRGDDDNEVEDEVKISKPDQERTRSIKITQKTMIKVG